MDNTYVDIVLLNLKRIINDEQLSLNNKIHALYNLMTEVSEEVTSVDRILFTTLFSRLAYIGTKYRLQSKDLHIIHQFRRACEKQEFGEDRTIYTKLGQSAIHLLLNAAYDSHIEVDYRGVVSVISEHKYKGYTPLIEGLALSVDLEECTIKFVDEKDGTAIRTVLFDISDKNEQFTSSIRSVHKHLKFPIHVNLLDVEYLDDNLVPQAFVFDPDYLLDVTAVAECFKDYGTETFLSILGRLKEKESKNIPLLIGNVANMCLDELITDPEIEFGEIIPKIFEYNPTSMVLYGDEEVKDIISLAKEHFTNLKLVVKGQLKKLSIDRSYIYLEPSFYSRQYGLQGRLDLFHQNEKAGKYDIVELKTGKIYKPNKYGLNGNHYIQTMLYDLLLKSTFGSKIKPTCYILYSKLGENSLKYAPAARAQQYEAMKVRNELIILEHIMAYSPEKLRSLFGYLKADNFKNVKGFVLTDLKGFEKWYLSLPSLYRDYFLSFMSFIKREQFLAKTGVHGLENSNGHSALWLENSQEKEERFALLKRLEILKNNTEEVLPTLKLGFTRETTELANFRQGDIAVLYPYQDDPQAVLHNQVFKCTILEVGISHVVVRLRSNQYNHSIFRKYTFWNVEEDKMDSAFVKSLRSVFHMLHASSDRISLLLGQKRPISQTCPVHNYEQLTGEQNTILKSMISAQDYFLLWGPPGTGKTSVMLRACVDNLLKTTSQNILLLAYTNRAVDEICAAVESIDPESKSAYVRIGSRAACDPRFQENMLNEVITGIDNRRELREKLASYRIYIGTLSSVINKPELLDIIKFDTTIVDEASQVLEPSIVGLLAKVKKFILIGDHKQLPAIVQQDRDACIVESEELNQVSITDLGMSFFERLYRRCHEQEWSHAYGILSQQGRMHLDLMQFVNEHFYENKLRVLPQVERLTAPQWSFLIKNNSLPQSRTVYIPSEVERTIQYKTNLDEAQKVAILIAAYSKAYGDRLDSGKIGVITPYRAQIALIKHICLTQGISLDNITIDTVERYQGGAREVIIISMCLNRKIQYRSLVNLSIDGVDRKLNVALTRAKEQIVIIGNEDLLLQQSTYKELIKSYNKWEGLVDA